MKKIRDIFFSMTGSVVLLVIFAFSIGYATFIENNSGTAHAREVVYNAIWFEVLLALLVINLTGSIFRHKLINRRKWTVLMFHLAFICILIGSAVTRYFGYEGIMHIREGETSDYISVDKTAVRIVAEYDGKKVEDNTEVNFAAGNSNVFSKDIEVGGKKIHIENQLFVPDAIETLEESENGEPAAGIFLMSGADESTDFTLFGDEKVEAGGVTFGFAHESEVSDISFSIKDNQLYLQSKNEFTKTGTLASGMIDRKNQITIPANTPCPGEENTVYRSGKAVFMIRGFYPKATKMLTPAQKLSSEMASAGTDAIMLNISDGKITRQINVFSNGENLPMPVETSIDGVNVSVSYGKMIQKLPFSITLRDFQLERYPGSMSPSSYASEITVTDTNRKSVLPYRIYMNNILNYGGFRFFQSSYDDDELGTILSVNHDYWGTLITYFGYFFMFLGMTLTLFNKNSRFRTLLRLQKQIQEKRRGVAPLIIALLVSLSGFTYAQNNAGQHIEKLNKLLVQDKAQGRVEPFGSFAADVLRKISKHNTFKGKDAAQVLIEMSAQPSVWKNELMIKVAHEELAKELNAVNGYVSYNLVFDTEGNYKLAEQIDKAYRKEESARNKFEKELINVDERINICTQIYMHDFFAFFPEASNENAAWTTNSGGKSNSATSSNGVCPYHASTEEMETMSGMESSGMKETAETQMPPATVEGHCTRNDVKTCPALNETENLFDVYLNAYNSAIGNNNWDKANDALESIKQFQLKSGGNNLPSENRVQSELLYNKLNVFINLMIAYAIIGVLVLLIHFLNIFKPHKTYEKLLDLSKYPLALLFILYTVGLAFRWYVSGHAPWSNGYESMIFVGWGATLSGLVFSKKSSFAFAVTALLAAIALSVAAMSWMNPEITNLVPVLKSYWLIVHVAVITSSYGFLAMAALLGCMNLLFITFRNQNNKLRLNDIIQEISYIIELSIIVGLFMLTIGTFLGGIWANESWGRYWGWDAKETWALVSVLVYAVIAHLRMIPKLNNPFVLSTAALVGFSSVIMTFVGVNYYLSGMHSYGQGNPPPVPAWIYVLVLLFGPVIYTAYLNTRKHGK